MPMPKVNNTVINRRYLSVDRISTFLAAISSSRHTRRIHPITYAKASRAIYIIKWTEVVLDSLGGPIMVFGIDIAFDETHI